MKSRRLWNVAMLGVILAGGATLTAAAPAHAGAVLKCQSESCGDDCDYTCNGTCPKDCQDKECIDNQGHARPHIQTCGAT